MNTCTKSLLSLLAVAFLFSAPQLYAENSSAESEHHPADLAKKLANPIANLISTPLQYNFDKDYGAAEDGSVSELIFEPVIPITLSSDWILITRTIVSLIDQEDIPAKGEGESGLGDILASQFFSPTEPTSSGWIWGIGPAELLPSATDDALGGEKWGLGPTGVALKQFGSWTIGGLTNHIWSVAGDGDRDDISETYIEPFVSYVTKTHTTIGMDVESTYDWKNDEWSTPVNVEVSQMLKLRTQILQLTFGARYWLNSPEYGPEGWGYRAQLTFLFPK